MAPKQVTQRVALDGGAEFKAALAALGAAGKDAFATVKAGIDSAGQSAVAMAPSIAALQKRFKEVQAAGGEFKTRFTEITNLVGDFGRKLAEVAALAVPLTGGGLIEAIIGGGRAASEIDKIATSLGISAKAFQELSYAAGQADISQEEFQRGLGRLENKVSEAQKAQVEYSKEYNKISQDFTMSSGARQKALEALNQKMRDSSDVFTRLGISTLNQDGSFRSVETILHRLLEEWPQLTKAQQASFASQLGFSRDRSMLNFLALGEKGVQKLVVEAQKVAPAFTDTERAVGKNLNESVNKLTAALTSMYNAARLAFAPFASAFAESLTERVGAIRQTVINFSQYLAGQLRPILTDIIKLLAGEEIDPSGFIGQVRSAWIEAKATFIEVYGILKSGWDAIVTVMDYVADAVNAVFGTNFSGKALAVIVLLGSITGAFSAIGSVIGLVIAGIGLFASVFGVSFGAIEAVIATVGYLIGYYFGSKLKADLLAIPQVFATVLTVLQDGWNGTIENFKNIFSAGLDALKSYFAGWVSWVLSAVQPVIDVINRITGANASGAGAQQGLVSGFSGGGGVSGPGSGTSDSIVARLSNGEYVVRAAAVSHYGSAFLNAINSMRLPSVGFSIGGLVDALSPRMPRYATGGMVSAVPQNNNPVYLQIGDSKFGPMMAGESTVAKLNRFAVGQLVSSGGKKPSWKGN